jgi:hypothetical protein
VGIWTGSLAEDGDGEGARAAAIPSRSLFSINIIYFLERLTRFVLYGVGLYILAGVLIAIVPGSYPSALAASRVTAGASFGRGGLVKNSYHGDYSYQRDPLAVGLVLSIDQLDSAVFQKNAIEPIENRKRAIELKTPYSYSLDTYLRCRILTGPRDRVAATISYHRPIGTVDGALKFSDHDKIFRALDFGLDYEKTRGNFRTVLGVNYSLLEGTFRDTIRISSHSYHSVGKNTVLMLFYDYLADREKSSYETPRIAYLKPDDNLLVLEHDNINYLIPRKSLLRRTHRITLANAFGIGGGLGLRLGATYSLERNGAKSYSLVLGFSF